jgi:hypothetical protein
MSGLTDWLKAFPRQDVERRIRELEAELMDLQDAINMHDKLGGNPSGNGQLDEPVQPNKPEAIDYILKEADEPLRSGVIRAEMVKRGWLEDDPKATKRFYSTMTRLKGEERIVHRADGRYELPQKGAPPQVAGLFTS